MAYRTNNRADSDLSQLSPDYTDSEVEHIWDGDKFSTPYLLPELIKTDLSSIDGIAIPLILIEKRYDRNVNFDIAADWFQKVKAPEKHLIWFEHSGHMPMTEGRGKFLLSIVQYARPIAE